MSGPLAHYSFLPWLRRGIGNKITEQDALGVEPTDSMSKERAQMDVGLTLESTSIVDSTKTQHPVTKTFKFLGPPDILAVSEKAIVRVEPKRGVNNYEANGLPYIEFYEEDFLWAYTPASAQTEKTTPWLALVCLKDVEKDADTNGEYELKSTSDGRAYVTIKDTKINDVFHDEKQHWAWGHVHLNTELLETEIDAQITEVSTELSADPDSGVSRLLCPRKLLPEVGYTAFLIPAFETGRLAGLGLEYTDVPAQKMSWEKNGDYAAKTRGYDFPVYYSWKFRTGLNGDFESLARLLKAVVTDPLLGKRNMFIADDNYGLEDFVPDTDVIGIEGALKPPLFTSDEWPITAADDAYQNHLRQLLNLSIDNETQSTGGTDSLPAHPFYSSTLGDDPIVTPEIYGRWHALATRLQTGSNYNWINEINLDPRNRATAGLGTQVIRTNQEDYMQRAWKQVKQVNEANQKIRKAALARLVNAALFQKHISPAGEDQTIRLTSAIHSFIPNATSGVTIKQTINQSIVPNATQSAAFKKITRPGKKLNRTINAQLEAAGKTLLHQNITQNFNGDTIKTAPLKTFPSLSVGLSSVNDAVTDALNTFQSDDYAMATQGVYEALSLETNFDNLNQAARKTTLKSRIDGLAYLNAHSKSLAKNLIDGFMSSVDGGTTDAHLIHATTFAFDTFFNHTLSFDASTPAVTPPAITAKVYNNIIIDRNTGGAPGVLSRATTTADITAFQDTFIEFQTYANADLVSIAFPPISSITAVKNTIQEKLNQKSLMISRLANAITVNVLDPVSGIYAQHNLDKLKPIMAYPKFDDPMFRSLKTISQEYILPNHEKIPENSITLLETNQAFIEAYMAGLNHEMSRELLWREYPTDQRGSYFRQFWDIADTVSETDPEKKYDVKKLPGWTGSLGTHSPRVISATGGTYLVLLIRGELLKKYPNTQVYAQKAEFKNPAHPRSPRKLSDETVAGNILTPVFMAELDPDIYLFGFDLDKTEAKGDSSDASKPGWYFVLRERPGQIRFGLDDWIDPLTSLPALPSGEPTNWNDLSWEHFVAQLDDLDNYQLDATHTFSASAGSANTPTATWGRNSADLAYVLYQNPVLFARHAQEMLP